MARRAAQRLKDKLLGRGLGTPYRAWASLKFLATRDRAAVYAFLMADYPFSWPLQSRLRYLGRLLRATQKVRGFHTLAELLTVSDRIFARAGSEGLTVVEAGAGPGGSTVKLSLAVQKAGGRLIVYDSFRGIPDNDERHQNQDGRAVIFKKGAFTGRLGAVRRAVERYGAPEVCEFRKGWFEDTLPAHSEAVHVALLDVDLLSSTQVCLQNLYPKMAPGGVIFSQDGHLVAIQALMRDVQFWAPLGGLPEVYGLGSDKLLELLVRRSVR